MTKKEMVQLIASELNVDQVLTKKIVQRFLDSMLDTLFTENRLELRNFGVFEIRQRASCKARNPRTNEEVIVPPKRIVSFQAGKNVAKRLAPEPSAESQTPSQ